MKNVILLFSCMAVFLCAGAQDKKTREVAAACEALRVAMVDPTRENLAALVTDSLSYGHSGGHIDRKEEFISKLNGGGSDFVSITITDQTIQLYKNTAIVRHNLSAETNDKNKPGTVKLHVMMVWVKEKGNWKLAARQAVKIPEPGH